MFTDEENFAVPDEETPWYFAAAGNVVSCSARSEAVQHGQISAGKIVRTSFAPAEQLEHCQRGAKERRDHHRISR